MRHTCSSSFFRKAVAGCAVAAALGLLVIAPGAGAIGPVGVDITTIEGHSFTGKVVDIGACSLASATIDWGDGAASDGTTDGGTGIQGTHTYAEESSYSGSVSYTYSSINRFCPAGMQSTTFQATVQDASLTGAGHNVSGVIGESLTAAVAHISDANPGASASDFSAQIVWGDGASTTGTVTAAAGGGFDVNGTHAFANTGSYSINTTVTDKGGASTSAASTAQIDPVGAVPPRNLTLPSIVPAVRCIVGHPACVAVPDTYTCDPGTWAGRDPAIPYQFVWIRLTLDKLTGRYARKQVATGPTFSPPAGLPVRGVQDNLYQCIVVASNSAGSISAASPQRMLSGPSIQLAPTQVDIHVTGIEVTQGIQTSSCNRCLGTLPERAGGSPFAPQFAQYQGVRMAAGHFTVVRVYASVLNHLTGPAMLTHLSGATATLEVLDSQGNRISVLNPDSAPAALNVPDCVLCVSLNDRANPRVSYNFLVPWQETEHRQLSFRAVVNPPAGLGLRTVVQCASCRANTFTLSGVPFVQTAVVPVHPIPLTVGNVQTGFSETDVFGDTQTVLPVNVRIFPYQAPLAVDQVLSLPFGLKFALPVNQFTALALLAGRASDDHYASDQYPVGVFVDGGPLGNGLTAVGRVLDAPPSFGPFSNPPLSIVADDRPLTSVSHEIGHGLGLVHADTGSPVPPPGKPFTGPHPDGTPDCGGNSNLQVGETWPANAPFDNEGQLYGVGLDRRNWNILQTGSLPKTIVAGYPAGSQYYDFMSYCGQKNGTASFFEASHWISVRNWERLIDFHPPAQALPAIAKRPTAASAAGETPLRVIATVDAAGNTSIVDVAPGQQATGPSISGNPFRIELRDASGGMLTSVIPATITLHADHQRPGLLLEATLPLTSSAAAVVVSDGGVDMARRLRSMHAPTAKILSPSATSRVGQAKTTLVRWSAHDADGDGLAATIDYSADGGGHWKVVADHATGRSVRLSSRLLSGSTNGRLRVRVSDGFDVATAISGRLAVAGRPPLVNITTSGRGGRVRADETLLLQGTAFDDAGQLLTGRHLRWYAGRRLLARGELLTVHGLPAGAVAIRLIATDARGRSSQAQLRLKVQAIRATFLLARAPMHVSPHARRVRMVVAATTVAVLKIGGVRHRVDRRRRTVTIAVRPGRSTLLLKYSLSSPGGTIRGAYVATR